MYFAGESNVAGAIGNLGGVKDLVYRNEPVQAVPMPYYGGGMGVETLAGGNFMGGQGSAINPEAFKKDTRQQKIYNKGMGTDNPNEREIFLKRTGPQLPFALGLDSSPLVAQVYPGGQAVGNAAALGGMMGAGPRFGPLPVNLDVNAVDDRIESIGGSANIDLGKNQRLQIGGTFNPAMTDPMGMSVPQGYEVFGAYQTPGFGVNVNYRNTGNRGGMPGGFPGQINAGFQGRF